MPRLVPAFVVALLVLALPVAAVSLGGTTPNANVDNEVGQTPRLVSPAQNTTDVLVLDGAARATTVEPSLTLTSAVRIGTGDGGNALAAYEFDERWQNATTADARRAVLENETERINARIDELERLQQNATRAYAAGELTATEYVQTMAYVDSRARGVNRLVEDAFPRARQLRNAQSIRVELGKANAHLATLTGPVRERAAAAIRDDQPPTRIYVAATASGFTLATIDDDTYVREAVDADAFTGSQGTIDTISEGQQQFQEAYPWGWNQSGQNNHRRNQRFWGQIAYTADITHNHGRLVAFIDANTTNVYSETQYQYLSSLPTGPSVSDSHDNRTLWVNRTYAGGPLRVAVTNATGAPLDASVRINGTTVGQTGTDGELWALSPQGTYNVTAFREGEQYNVTVSTLT
ncbi:DUF7094 domain-containing protein [Halocalculus aciditolerans]|uniref:DUF7094 domain-containing protein n=1 Tax=Halocalculus aciditolerans TaxID=1383812 RepID=UPI00166E62E6|nr:hypothetical protein [Halocalculus aciditolerans]